MLFRNREDEDIEVYEPLEITDEKAKRKNTLPLFSRLLRFSGILIIGCSISIAIVGTGINYFQEKKEAEIRAIKRPVYAMAVEGGFPFQPCNIYDWLEYTKQVLGERPKIVWEA